MKVGKGVIVIAAALIGLALGFFASRALGLDGGGQVQVVEGYAWVNQDGTAIGLSPDGETPGTGYVVAGAMWRKLSGPWRDTFPTCLEPLVTGQRIRLGVLEARPQGEAPGRPVVVWLECLGREGQDLAERPANDDLESARETLIQFFEHLNKGDYLSASALYGGSYEMLNGYNPDLDPEDHAALFKNACTVNGFQCLQVRSARLQEQAAQTGDYRFVVEFSTADGELFVLGPCCGATETEMPLRSEFVFTVVRVGEGAYQVVDLPVYAP